MNPFTPGSPEYEAWERAEAATLDQTHEVFTRWLGDEYDLDALDVTLATAAAERATWSAEKTRLHGLADVQAWTSAANAWESCGQPHGTAYALWRLAEAISSGSDTTDLVEPVLRRAELLAVEHVPLRDEIRALAGSRHIDLDGPGVHETPGDHVA